MSSDSGGMPEILACVAISHRPSLTLSLIGSVGLGVSAAPASSAKPTPTITLPAIFQCSSRIIRSDDPKNCLGHLKSAHPAQQLAAGEGGAHCRCVLHIKQRFRLTTGGFHGLIG